MKIRTSTHKEFVTKNDAGEVNGKLIPLYNIHDAFFEPGKRPEQVYLTTVLPEKEKGPHLHLIRTGFFTCIKGNVRIILKVDGEYKTLYSGDQHEYRSVEVPVGVPALIQCLGSEEAYVLNMPNPAWTAEMNDEHSADFSDFENTAE